MIRDYKNVGLPKSLSSTIIDWCIGLCAIIVVLTAYLLVTDIPDRQVVTMTAAEFSTAIAQARIEAARETMAAVGKCDWRDLFEDRRKGPL